MSDKYYRRVIRVQATDSPSVRRALEQQSRGEEPDDLVVVPGVLPWSEYLKRLATWDKIRIHVGLMALFWEGASALLYPPGWLDRSHHREFVEECRAHPAEAVGVDPAAGGDSTAMAAVNRWGVKELVSKRTPDTNVIPDEALAFCRRHNVSTDMMGFDAGGGGKMHADRLRAQGHRVRLVAFGESLALKPKTGKRSINERLEAINEKAAHANRRAEMYGTLSELLDPCRDPVSLGLARGSGEPPRAFAIPPEYLELRRQLAPIPRMYDLKERLILPPKHRKPGSRGPGHPDAVKSLEELIGCSPDEADAVCIATFVMLSKPVRPTAGALR